MTRIIWLLGREGGIGFSSMEDGDLLMVSGDATGTPTRDLIYVFNRRTCEAIVELLQNHLNGQPLDGDTWPADTLWGDGPTPTLG